ncbi:helix-turn-helix domain-containing protein [Streptomyces goshikiensis]|uniref:helix-turn-helix domain-containing protein n=1 Tax=Streptomyces goshikiensis TaxID=1942 RepID=UPI0036DB36A2
MDGQDEQGPLSELKRELKRGQETAGLGRDQLAARTGLSPTTLHNAINHPGRVPSAETLRRLAAQLGLDLNELLDLRHRAVEQRGGITAEGVDVTASADRADAPWVGRPILECDPYDLEVKPAPSAGGGRPAAGLVLGSSGRSPSLPGYVRRDHDHELAQVVRAAAGGASGLLFLVGSSSTGKTRACWEAVRSLGPSGWRLWHPFDPSRAEAAVAGLSNVEPCTVVWLNDAQDYFDHSRHGETIAAALHTLLTDPGRGPVLVLGTLWPKDADRYCAPARPEEHDEHARVRELLAGRLVTVSETFDEGALGSARAIAEAGDEVLAGALSRAANGRVTQDLGGVPELLRRYRNATPGAKALLHAAMDARRFGVQRHLPVAFLTEAADDYLTEHEYDTLPPDWPHSALDELTRPAHGYLSPLQPARSRPARHLPGLHDGGGEGAVVRLADYLEQHGRAVRAASCPPGSFWQAASTRLTRPEDLDSLASAAHLRARYQWAYHLYQQAADAGLAEARSRAAGLRRQLGDQAGAETLYRQAADEGEPSAWDILIAWREESGDHDGAHFMAMRRAEAGDPHSLTLLADMRKAAGKLDEADRLYRHAADTGNPDAVYALAQQLEAAGNLSEAEALYRRAGDGGHVRAWYALAMLLDAAGRTDQAEALARRTAKAGRPFVLGDLAVRRAAAGDLASAVQLAREAAQAGHKHALFELAHMQHPFEDSTSIKLMEEAAKAGSSFAQMALVALLETAGRKEAAEAYAWQAGKELEHALSTLARLRGANSPEGEALLRRGADANDPGCLHQLALLAEKAGRPEDAEFLARRSADAGGQYALIALAEIRAAAGDAHGAERLYRQAADTGWVWSGFERWPHGLDPDGTPSHPWPLT